MELKTGITGKKSLTVTEKLTAASMASGTLPVLATPVMVALMEEVSKNSVMPYLAEGQSTVGTSLNVRHVSATPVGMEVSCEATLAEIDGRRLVFEVKAYDAAGVIGEGTHERFIVDNERFMAKAEAKNQANSEAKTQG